MYQANMDLGIFQKIKFTKSTHTHESSGYRVMVREAPSTHSRGVAVFYRLAEPFYVEAI